MTRRALSQWHGPVTQRGDRAAFTLLRCAMEAPIDSLRLSHEFHVYPARLPSSLARTILATAEAGQTVLDPFCGSGTTLVEARVRGCRAIGRDINPLATRLARLKTSAWPRPRLQTLRQSAARATIHARSILEDRSATPPPESARSDFSPHVAWELAALLDALVSEPESEALLLCFSSILVKLSRHAGTTSRQEVEKRIPTGRALRVFLDRVQELAARLEAFTRALPSGVPEADIALGDARTLTGIAPESVDLVLTSPPYAGQISYTRASEISRTWLSLDEPKDEMGERGGRRQGAYRKDLSAAMKAVRRVLKPGASLFVVIGGLEPEALVSLSPGFRFVASASQRRPLGQKEHLVLLQ